MQLRAAREGGIDWRALVALARHDLDAMATDKLARLRRQAFASPPDAGDGTRPVRLALLGSLTLSQLEPGIIVGGLRRGLWVETWTAEYGQYLQEITDPDSELARFAPTHLLLAFDARTAAGRGARAADGADAVASFADHVETVWTQARARFPNASILQQTLLPILPRVMGSNERRHAMSPAALIDAMNAAIASRADAAGVDLIDPSSVSAGRDPATWYDPLMWFKAKQEVSLIAAPLYGDVVGRLLAAQQGRSAKCLVLDLDNTLWGGVIGDDGLEGIVLGQGSPAGEAFLAVQAYALALSRRGIILAVCSKNDEANALLPFEQHPEMLLKRSDISAFVANWNDKASNLRAIAEMLNIGVDSLVFLDDNPFERNQVRGVLPSVGVPEVGDDPGLFATSLADGGYFESVTVTAEDLKRREQYAANAERAKQREGAGDISSYLASLEMRMPWQFFRPVDHERTVQLINKTNQFNLTTRRYSSADVLAVAEDPRAVGMTFRLLDNFGDNGIIAIVIARIDATGTALIDTWLMSCRVLGRGVEAATLDVLVRQVEALGATSLIGLYVPSEKNAMVRDHYNKLGFVPEPGQADDPAGSTRSRLTIADYKATPHFINVEEPAR
jgi:FkbH-like protein